MNKKDFSFVDSMMHRGAIVGHTTSSATRLWIRTKRPGTYCLLLSRSPLHGLGMFEPEIVRHDGQKLLKTEKGKVLLADAIPFETSRDGGHSAVIDVDGLEAATRYNYAVIEQGAPGRWELGSKSRMGFRTLPQQGNRLSFGLYSCHMPFRSKIEPAELGMWPGLRTWLDRYQCSFVIGGGDQVYADGAPFINIWNNLERTLAHPDRQDISEAEMLDWYRELYRAYWGFGEVRDVHANIPNYMIWDDHESKDGWGSFDKDAMAKLFAGYQHSDAAIVSKKREWIDRMGRAAEAAYVEFQHSHNPPTPGQVEYDYTISHCNNDFFVLDMRKNKNYDSGIVLGDAQFGRLKAWLAGMQANAAAGDGNRGPIFIVSSVPMVHLKDWLHNEKDLLQILASQFGAKDDFFDHWEHGNNRAEMKRVMDLVFDCAAKTGRPAVFLSGDVHVAAAYRLTSAHHGHEGAGVFQVTSSPISYPTTGAGGAIAKKRSGEILNTPYRFEQICPVYTDHNVALIRTEVEGDETTEINVDLVGRDKHGNETVVWHGNLIDCL
jgi:alkaline phosphatase D